jgi:hypothetical protein
MISTQKNAKNAKKYECEICDYNTCNKTDYNRHLSTDKHQKMQNSNVFSINSNDFSQKNARPFSCKCGKMYKYKSNLYLHHKKCNFEKIKENKNLNKNQNNELFNIENTKNNIETIRNDEELNYKDMFLEVMKQNKILQSTVIEQSKQLINIIPIIHSTNNIINNNQKIKQNVNINVFLNETCKDAINMSDFIKNIEISLNDLKCTGQKGLIEGISNLFINNLNKLPPVSRPIWCSDKKRKKLYIKENEWTEDENNIETKKAIENISKIQSKNINKYIYYNPQWMTSESDKETYLEIVKNVTEHIDNKTDKIIDKLIDSIHLHSNIKHITNENVVD